MKTYTDEELIQLWGDFGDILIDEWSKDLWMDARHRYFKNKLTT